jgi:predicted NUDIX family phosphoesterase
VYAFASPTETVEAASADIAVVGWRTLDQLRQPDIYDRLEDWSKEVVDFLIR